MDTVFTYSECDVVGIIAPALKLNVPKELILYAVDIEDEKVSLLADAIFNTPLTGLLLTDCGITEKRC